MYLHVETDSTFVTHAEIRKFCTATLPAGVTDEMLLGLGFVVLPPEESDVQPIQVAEGPYDNQTNI